MKAPAETPSILALAVERLACVPPKWEQLDTDETRGSLSLLGSDGILFS